ncbi:MAG: nucleoside deaminase [Desulfopila sp.]
MDQRDRERHEHFMRLALVEAEKALTLAEFPVGCVIVSGDDVVASGARANSGIVLSELDHAEIVALRSVAAQRPDIDLGRVTVYSTMEPCLMCYATLVVNGVKNMVYAYEDVMGGGTSLPLASLAPLYASLQVKVVSSVLREESLRLFQRFFRAPNGYLQNTLLANYTLQQPCNSTP